MILSSRQPTKLIPRADFKPDEFRKVIFSHGMDLSWEQVAECPCSRESGDYGFNATLTNTEHMNQSRADCPACKGRGYLYHSKQDIKAVITGLKKTDQRHSNVGGSEFTDGQIGITLLPEHLPALGDRFTVKTSAILYRETLVYKTGVSTRYPIIQRSHDLQSGAVSFGVRHMIKSNADGIVNPTNTLEEGTDFTVNANGSLTWINEPNNGERVSLSYYANPVYIITSQPHTIRDTFIKFKNPNPTHSALPIYAEGQLEFYGPPKG